MMGKSAAVFRAGEICNFGRMIAVAKGQPVLFEGRLGEMTQQQGSIRHAVFPDRIVVMDGALVRCGFVKIECRAVMGCKPGIRGDQTVGACKRGSFFDNRIVADRKGACGDDRGRDAVRRDIARNEIVVEGSGCRPVDLQRRLRQVVEKVAVNIDVLTDIGRRAGCTD